jgi:two-component system, OmpR family, response regulator
LTLVTLGLLRESEMDVRAIMCAWNHNDSLPVTSSAPLSVLIVDDESGIRDLLATYLRGQGIIALEAQSEATMLSQIAQHSPDVILLDVNLGTEDGFAVARKLRQSWHGGLMMVTGRGDTIDRVVGLELGADDYVTKPFELRELLARVRSVGRRTGLERAVSTRASEQTGTETIAFDGFALCRTTRQLHNAAGELVPLTTGEFDLLCVLLDNAGRVLSRDDLLRKTHNRDAAPFDRTIDVQVGRLRKKIGDTSNPPKIIKSVRGAGYVLAATVRKRD